MNWDGLAFSVVIATVYLTASLVITTERFFVGKLDGKIAVITGGSSGIGLAAAKKFVAEGATVYITGRRRDELDNAKAAIGEGVFTIQGDVAQIADIDQLWDTVGQQSGSVDIIVTSAGVAPTISLTEVTPEHFDRTFNVNARGTFFTVQKALPLINEGGSIVLVSGVGHMLGWTDLAAYSGSKAAVRSFARSWAAGLLDKGIRVNSISPGPVETPILDTFVSDKADSVEVRAGLVGTVPMGRLAESTEIANAILFLASNDASFITGTDLVVDGGSTQL